MVFNMLYYSLYCNKVQNMIFILLKFLEANLRGGKDCILWAPQGTLYPRGHFTPGDTLPCYFTVLRYKSHGRINADLTGQVNQCEEY